MFVLSPTDNRRGRLCRPASLDFVGPAVAEEEIAKTFKVRHNSDEDVACQQCGQYYILSSLRHDEFALPLPY
jgi:hypothetical protein